MAGVAIGAMVVGAASTAYSGDQAADAAKKGAQLSADTQRYMYDQTRADYEPYRNVGASALDRLASMYGLEYDVSPQIPQDSATAQIASLQGAGRGPASRALNAARINQLAPLAQEEAGMAEFQPSTRGSSTPDFSGFFSSPDYTFAFDQGQRAVEQSLAKRGLSGSGAERKALTRFGQGLASQQLNNYKNSLASLAGIGQTSTQSLGVLGANTASGIAQDQRSAADARASAYLNTGSAISGTANKMGQYALLRDEGYI